MSRTGSIFDLCHEISMGLKRWPQKQALIYIGGLIISMAFQRKYWTASVLLYSGDPTGLQFLVCLWILSKSDWYSRIETGIFLSFFGMVICSRGFDLLLQVYAKNIVYANYFSKKYAKKKGNLIKDSLCLLPWVSGRSRSLPSVAHFPPEYITNVCKNIYVCKCGHLKLCNPDGFNYPWVIKIWCNM